MATHTTLGSLFSDIADAIREKTGSSDAIVADNFPTAISDIRTGSTTFGNGVGQISSYELMELGHERPDLYDRKSNWTEVF